jgi:hypothetical protein
VFPGGFYGYPDYYAFHSDELCEFDGGATSAGGNSAACASCDSGSGASGNAGADFNADCACAGTNCGAKRSGCASQSKHDAANDSDRAADADHDECGGTGNTERSSATAGCGCTDGSCADSATGKRAACESRDSARTCGAVRKCIGHDDFEFFDECGVTESEPAVRLEPCSAGKHHRIADECKSSRGESYDRSVPGGYGAAG